MKKNYFFVLSVIRFCQRLIIEHVQKISLKLIAMNYEIIMFEVFSCAVGIANFEVKVYNYANLGFCTISMCIMSSTCILNLRCKE